MNSVLEETKFLTLFDNKFKFIYGLSAGGSMIINKLTILNEDHFDHKA